MPKKRSTGGKKAKSPVVSKTNGKESTSALGAEVVVEQPPVDKTGGKTESESTRVVASNKDVPPDVEQQAVLDLIASRTTTISFPTNVEGVTGNGEKNVVVKTTFMCSQKSQDDSSNEGKRDDNDIIADDDEEVPPVQGSNTTALEAPKEKEASSDSADKAEIVAMPMETDDDLHRERQRIVSTTVAIPIYTKEMIREMIEGSEKIEDDVLESFHTKLLECMRLRKNIAVTNSGFRSSDSMVAVSEDLFPSIARGYIHSEYNTIDTFKTTVHQIQNSHEASQKDFAERFSVLSKEMLDRFSALSTRVMTCEKCMSTLKAQ